MIMLDLPPMDAPSVVVQAKLFRGLSDPSRLSILRSIIDSERNVSQIVESTGLSQPNVSAHLACLRDCGLVLSRQEGRSVIYSVADERLRGLLQSAQGLLESIAPQIKDCERYNP